MMHGQSERRLHGRPLVLCLMMHGQSEIDSHQSPTVVNIARCFNKNV